MHYTKVKPQACCLCCAIEARAHQQQSSQKCMAGNQGDNVPAAFLNYILFDQQYNVLNMGWRPVTTASNWYISGFRTSEGLLNIQSNLPGMKQVRQRIFRKIDLKIFFDNFDLNDDLTDNVG